MADQVPHSPDPARAARGTPATTSRTPYAYLEDRAHAPQQGDADYDRMRNQKGEAL